MSHNYSLAVPHSQKYTATNAISSDFVLNVAIEPFIGTDIVRTNIAATAWPHSSFVSPMAINVGSFTDYCYTLTYIRFEFLRYSGTTLRLMPPLSPPWILSGVPSSLRLSLKASPLLLLSSL